MLWPKCHVRYQTVGRSSRAFDIGRKTISPKDLWHSQYLLNFSIQREYRGDHSGIFQAYSNLNLLKSVAPGTEFCIDYGAG